MSSRTRPAVMAVVAGLAATLVAGGAPGSHGAAHEGPTRGLTFLATGATRGEILPCGCMWSASGGLSRRAVVMETLRREAAGDVVTLVDLGNLASGDTITGDVVNAALYDDMGRLGYRLVNVGVDDAAAGVDALRAIAERTGARLLSANLVYHDSGEPVFEPYALVGGGDAPTVAVLGLTRPDRRLLLAGERNRSVLVTSPAEAAARWLPEIRDRADHVVAVTDLLRHHANDVMRKTDGILALLMPSVNDMPEETVQDARGVLSFGDEGHQVYAYRVGPGGETSGRTVTLRETMEPDAAVEAGLQPVLDRVNAALREAHEGVEPLPLDDRYIGAETCASCHGREHAIWSGHRHATAFQSLVRANREWAPACNVCHVTGAGDDEAWLDPAHTPQLAGVQCESCHGPGAEHAAAPGPGYGLVNPAGCGACHNESWSPDFTFGEWWPRIRHGSGSD